MKYFISLLALILLFTACEEVEVDCVELQLTHTTAITAFESAETTATCTDVVESTQALFDGSCEMIDGQGISVAVTQDVIDDITIGCELAYPPDDDTDNPPATELSVVGSWEIMSMSMQFIITTNQDVTLLAEDAPGTGAINVTGDPTADTLHTDFLPVALNGLDLNDDDGDGTVDRIEASYNNDDEDIWAEYRIYTNTDYYSGESQTNSSFNYDDWDNDLWLNCHSILEEGPAYSIDTETLTLTVTADTLNCYHGGLDFYIYVSGTLTGATVTVPANVATVIMEDEDDESDDYDHWYITFNADGSTSYLDATDCEDITDDEECEDYGCVWDETAVSCGQFTGSCSDFDMENCYANDWHCRWDYDEEQCVAWDDNDDDGPSSWSITSDGVLTLIDTEYYYDYYDSTDVTETHTMVFETSISPSGSVLTLLLNINPCDLEDSYYGYYMSYYCEYEGLTDEECSAECLEAMAGDMYGLEEGMLVSISQNISYSFLSVDLGRLMDNTDIVNFLHKRMRQKLAKGIANHLRQMAQ